MRPISPSIRAAGAKTRMTMDAPNIVNICPKCKKPGNIIEDPNVDPLGYYNITYSHEDGTTCEAGRAIEMDRLVAKSVPHIRKRRPSRQAIVAPCPKCGDIGRHFQILGYPHKESWVCYHNDIEIGGYWKGPYGPIPRTKRCSYFKITEPGTGKITITDMQSKDNAPIDEICPYHKTMARRFVSIETNRSGTKRKRIAYEHRDGEAKARPGGRKSWPRCYVNEKVDKPKLEHEKLEQMNFRVRPIVYNKFKTQAKQNNLKLTEAIEQALILWTLQSTRKASTEPKLQGAPITK
jgi:hypothetical protein